MEIRLKIDQSKNTIIQIQNSSLFSMVAMFGGFSKGFTLLLFFFVFPIREIKYYRQLINSMFSVCMTPEQVETAMKIISDEVLGAAVEPDEINAEEIHQ